MVTGKNSLLYTWFCLFLQTWGYSKVEYCWNPSCLNPPRGYTYSKGSVITTRLWEVCSDVFRMHNLLCLWKWELRGRMGRAGFRFSRCLVRICGSGPHAAWIVALMHYSSGKGATMLLTPGVKNIISDVTKWCPWRGQYTKVMLSANTCCLSALFQWILHYGSR